MALRASADGEPLTEAVMDIWHRSHGIAPVAGLEAALTPSLAAGVLPHVAERIVGGEGVAPGGRDDVGFPSVGAVFEAAEAEAIPWLVLQGADAADGLPWDEDARTRLEARLADGWVAIAPARPVALGGRERVGWWLFDPVGGRLVDELDDGRGVQFTEWLARIKGVIDGLPVWARLGLCIFTLFRGMYAVLEVGIAAIEGRLASGRAAFYAFAAATTPWAYRGMLSC
jgi:hypothetical protein